MAHEIGKFDGLALNRTKAWHGLGVVVSEDMNPTQALQTAGLDWEVVVAESVECKLPNGGVIMPVTKARPLFRAPSAGQGNYIELGSVGPTYTPIQNRQLADLAWEFGKDVKVESAGSIRDGQRVWFLLRGETFDGNADAVQSYLALMNGHDGLNALSVYPTSVRVVCANTLTQSFNDAKRQRKLFKVSHTLNAANRVQAVAQAIQQFRSVEAVFANNMQALRNRKVSNEAEVSKFWQAATERLFPNMNYSDPRELAKVGKLVDSWQATLEAEMLELGVNVPDAWLMANAVTNHIQHDAPGRKMEGWESRRVESNFLGENADLCDSIFRDALAF